MMKNRFKSDWEIYGSNTSWFYMGFSAIERLIQTTNTVWYFHAKIKGGNGEG
jgi:hypothetical protein